MKLPLIRKYLFISLGFTALFLVISFLLLQLYFEVRRKTFEANPPSFNAWVIDSSGKVLESSGNDALPVQFDKNNLPTSGMIVPLGSGEWPHDRPAFVIKMQGNDHRFAVFAPAPRPPAEDNRPHRHHPFLLPIVVIVAAILLGSASSVIVLLKKLFDELKLKERSRASMLQDLAHDLRTPIASLQNNLSLLSGEQGTVNEASKTELVGTSKKEADYIEKLVNDLLMLSQITADDSPLVKTPVDLTGLIEDELDILKAGRQASIHVHIESPSEPAIISGNALLLKRLFRNIIQNALDFARSEIIIRINVDRSVPGSQRIRITIDDNGAGFAAEALKNYGERKTTRFFDPSSNGRISVGLGSVIVSTIANLHGARVIPSNHTDVGGGVSGARVEVIF